MFVSITRVILLQHAHVVFLLVYLDTLLCVLVVTHFGMKFICILRWCYKVFLTVCTGPFERT